MKDALWIDRLLDASLVGYTRVGYSLRARGWGDGWRDQTGRTFVVTGATSGLGRATALWLLRIGASVVAVGRNQNKLRALREDACRWNADDRLVLERADLCSIGETRALAQRILDQVPELDGLVNNAGVLLHRREITAEGFEASFATNLLSHLVLTEALLPALRRGETGRVINVSSGGMYTQRLRVADLQLASMKRFDGVVAYAHAKRGQVVLTEMWAERWDPSEVVVHAMHPGWADTPGVQRSLPVFRKITRAVLRDAQQGADTSAWLCAAPEVLHSTGRFWHDRQERPTHRTKKTRISAEERRIFWETMHRWADEVPEPTRTRGT